MKQPLKAILSWVLCFVLLLGCIPMETAHAGVTIHAWMDSYTPGNTITIMWYTDVEGADHYDCTVLNETTGKYARSRSTSSSGYDCYVTAKTAGVYKIWVGAVDASGNDITSSITRITVNETSDECDEHDWDDDTGECIECGEECPHNNGVYEVKGSSYSESISDTQHKIIWTYDEECKICRYVLESDATRSETGSHKFDSNGDCTLCNYRAACKHTQTTTEHLTTSYDQHNESQHTVKVVSHIICANANCGKLIEYGGHIDTYKESHSMSNDKCTLCGYAVEYEPVTVTISRGQSSAYIGDGVTASCSPSGGTGDYSYYWTVYFNGSEIYSTTSWDKRASYDASQEGTYSFSVRVEDRNNGDYASATTSGITVSKAPCQHPNQTTIPQGDPQYIKASDIKHTVRTNWATVCGDCGETLSSWYSDEAQDHNYSGSNCVNCGAAAPAPDPTPCTHPSMTSIESSRTYRATTSETEHLADIAWEDYCSSCNILLNKTRTSSEYGPHTYDGLVCTLCGFAKQDPNASTSCDHANHKTEEVSQQVKQYDDQMHIVITVSKVSCADCGISLNDAASDEKYVYHSLNGEGHCSSCGYTAVSAPVVTEAPVTPVPVTEAPATPVPVTEAPVTPVPVTEAPATPVPVTEAPSTPVPVTEAPATPVPVTDAPKVCSIYGAEHVYDYTGYEAAHETELDYPGSHNIFKRCKCGHVIYTGKTKTTLNKSVCCYCGNHQYGETYQDGTDQKQKCRNCSQTKVVGSVKNTCAHANQEVKTVPVGKAEPYNYSFHAVATNTQIICTDCGQVLDELYLEKNYLNHDFSVNITSAKEHPHQVSGYCDCGEFTDFLEVYAKHLNCCQCVGHNWEVSYYGGAAHRLCLVCGETTQEVTIESIAWEEYRTLDKDLLVNAEKYRKYATDKTGTDMWRIVALQGTEKLTDAGFVFGVLYTDALQSAGTTMVDAATGKYIQEDKYTNQQVELWKELIVKTLTEQEKAGAPLAKELAEQSDLILGTTHDTLDEIYIDDAIKTIEHEVLIAESDIKYLKEMVGDLNVKLDSLTDNMVGTNPNYANELELAVETKEKIGELQKRIDGLEANVQSDKSIKAIADSIPWVLSAISAVAEGGDNAAQAMQMREAYEKMEEKYEDNVIALTAIISDATAMNNAELKKAAENVLSQVTAEHLKRNLGVWKEVKNWTENTEAFLSGAADPLLDTAIDAGFDALIDKLGGSYMGVVSIGATVVDTVTNHAEVYQSAEKLMALGTMSAGMDLYDVTKNATGTDYTYKLWAELQAMGCDQAIEYINQHEDSGLFKVTIDELGIPANKRDEVTCMLTDDKLKYLNYGNQRTNTMSVPVSITNPDPTPEPSPTPAPAAGDSSVGRYCTVHVKVGNVRSDAGTNYATITSIEKNERFKVLDSKQGSDGKVWYKIYVKDSYTYGWVSSTIVTLND